MSTFTSSNSEVLLALSERQNHRCVFCYTHMELHQGGPVLTPKTMTREHTRPRSLGGSDHESNLVASCSRCNSLRGNLHAELFAAIVSNLHQDVEIKENWHSDIPIVTKLIRKIIKLEVTYAYAFVCRQTAFEVWENDPRFKAKRAAVP